MVRAP